MPCGAVRSKALAASTAEPDELPWDDALPVCPATIKLVSDGSSGWKRSTHWLHHSGVKAAVFAVLGAGNRLIRKDAAAEADVESDGLLLPTLPPEIWLIIIQFVQRSWWVAVQQPEVRVPQPSVRERRLRRSLMDLEHVPWLLQGEIYG